MNEIQEKKEIIFYFLIFTLTCYSFYLLYLFILPFFYFGSVNYDGPGIWIILPIGIIYLVSKFLQILVPIIGSIWIIKNSSNYKLLRIYNSLRMPTFIFVICLCIDFIIKTLFIKPYDIAQYFSTCSLSINFIPIYLVSIVNNILLKYKKV